MPIRLYFFRADSGGSNFGDELSPLIVSFLTGQKVERSDPMSCDLTGTGSILDRFTRPKGRFLTGLRKSLLGREIAVWGTGLIQDKGPRRHNLRLLAVRGNQTRDAMTKDSSLTLGDPGLLVGRMIRKPATRSPIGVVPHYTDRSDPMVQALRAMPGVKIIDVDGDAMAVVRDIAACGVVLSSSLHGLIVADSFGIPNHHLRFGGRVKGGDFKFLDYASAIGRPDIAATSLAAPEDLLHFPRDAADFSYQSGIDRVCDALERSLRADF